MPSPHEFDYSVPYDIMVGVWTGVTITYGPTGHYLSTAASNVVIYWHKAHELMHFRQVEQDGIAPLKDENFKANLNAVRSSKLFQNKKSHNLSQLSSSMDQLKDAKYLESIADVMVMEFDLHVFGKHASGSSSVMDVTGVNSRPDTYLFHLRRKDGAQSWFNNQYFTNANERQIIGPQLDKDGNIQMVLAQTFSRVSYEVPEKYKHELKA